MIQKPAAMTLLSLALIAPAWAQNAAPAAEGPAPFVIRPTEAYDVAQLPDDHYGRMVRYGKELAERTFAHIGPEVRNPKMRFAGNNLACTSCHQNGATKPFAMPWVGVHAAFPQYRGREDDLSTVAERVNGCMERSMAGKPLPLDSREMKAFETYIHFLSKDVPTGAAVVGQGLPKVKMPNRRADTVAGAQLYAAKCAACHGENGAGVRAGAGNASGYTFPPLWGKDSFNNGAGMNRLVFATTFVYTNMPLGSQHGQPQLSVEEAYDIAAHMLSQPRGRKAHLERDFPARWNKPVDAAFPPYVDGAPADQHKFGPFPPLAENMKQLKDKLLKESGR